MTDLALKDRPTEEAPPSEDTKNQPDPAGGGDEKPITGADDKPDDKAGDKGAGKAPKGGSLFDDLDDDDGDDAGDDKGKKETPAKPDADKGDDKAGDEKPAETDEEKRDRLAADAQWRDRIAEKIIGPLKDKLTAKKFEQRREQLINQLKRFKSIDDAIASGVLAQEKLRAGAHKRPADEATPEEQATWRKENGIPESADKYEIPVVAGHTWSEKDQPTIDGFRAAAHESGLDQTQVNRLVNWHIMEQQRVAEEMDGQLKRFDQDDREACFDQIRTEFGVREFKPHMAVMKRLIEDPEVFGEANAEHIMAARYFDEDSGMWRRLTSIPGVARGLIGMALDRYGDVSMPSGDGTTKAGKSRLDEITHIMNTDMDRYYREKLADEAMDIQREIERKEARRRK
jgi:hypothetical protein